MKSQIENAGEVGWGEDGRERKEDSNRRLKTQGGIRIGRGRWRRDGGLKSMIENAGDEWMGRGGGKRDGGLKSQIENAGT